MRNTTPVIVGAGLAGLLAAHAWPGASLVEAAARPTEVHKAVLRFRTRNVANLVGIEFRAVRVHKGIWQSTKFVEPNIRSANLYAQKVLGAGALRGDRSIWNLAPVERFIAPDTLYAQLLDSVGHRVRWGEEADFAALALDEPVVSTAPLPIALASLDIETKEQFRRAPITVRRWRIPGADVFQTVYFPTPEHAMYRASITGDMLIAEFSSADAESPMDAAMDDIKCAFGVNITALEFLGVSTQRYGKIDPISDTVRKNLLFQLTHKHNVFSLGRFATWRNILLDDVVDDITVIKRLLRASSEYELRKAAS